MPPRKKREGGKDKGKKEAPIMGKDVAICGVLIPGPRYRLKTLVGYKEHCISKYRNPAYTFGVRPKCDDRTIGPGPKYKPKDFKRDGYTFGMAIAECKRDTGPGPKYDLPRDRGPAFLMKWRTKPRKIDDTPAPYPLKSIIGSPAFTIGLFTPARRVKASAGPYSPYDINATNPRAPVFSIGRQYELTAPVRSPGPKYYVKSPKPVPAFSFGMKRSPCAPPYITECDDRC